MASSNEETGTSVYYMPNNEELFHFFFIAIPLYEELQKFKAAGNIPPSLTHSSFFDDSDVTRGHVFCRLLKYGKARECYDRALQQDPENLSIEIRRISIVLIIEKHTEDTDKIRENLDTLLCKIDQSWSEPHRETTLFVNRLGLDEILQLVQVLHVASWTFYSHEYSYLECNIMDYVVAIEGRGDVLMKTGLLRISPNDFDRHHNICTAISLVPSLIDKGVSTKNILSLNNLGQFLFKQRKYEEAYRCFQRALIMGHVLYGTRPNLNMMTSLNFLGYISFSLAKNTESKFFFELLVQRFESFGGAPCRCVVKKAYKMLGILSGYYSEEEAVCYLEKSLKVTIESQNCVELEEDVSLYCTLATIWHAQDNEEKAWETVSNAKACLGKIVHIPCRVGTCCILANTLADLNKTNEGIEILKEEVQKLTSQSHTEEKAICLMELGKRCLEQDLASDAENYYKQALEVMVDMQDNKGIFHILECRIGISEAIMMDNRESEAKNVLDQAFILAKKLPTSEKKICFLQKMGILWDNFGDIIRTKQCFDDAIRTYEELTNCSETDLFMEVSLELKLGELAKKVYAEIAMHRSHYDRAAEALKQLVATGRVNSLTVELFLKLAVAYKSVDLNQTRRLLLITLKVSVTLYGKKCLNGMVAKILEELSHMYLIVPVSSPFHEHTSQNLMMLALVSMKRLVNTDEVERTYKSLLSVAKVKASTDNTEKASAARCFTSLGILFYTSGDLEKAETVNEMARQLFSEIHKSVGSEKLPCETTCDVMKEILGLPSILPSDQKKLSVFIGEATDALCLHGNLEKCSDPLGPHGSTAEVTQTSKNCSNGRENAELFIPSSKSREIDLLINDAIRAKEDYISAIKVLDLALQLPCNWSQKTKILKLRGECYLSRGDFRTATINFNEAAGIYSSRTVGNGDDLFEYSEVLIGLIKSEMLCQNVAGAWLKCQEAIELVSDHEHRDSIHLQEIELLYLGAKCLDILSDSAESKDDKLAQACSLCQQAVLILSQTTNAVEQMEECGSSRSCGSFGIEFLALTSEAEKLTDNCFLCKQALIIHEIKNGSEVVEKRGSCGPEEFFTLFVKLRLLLAAVVLKLRNKNKAESNLKDMEEFLKNAVVRFKSPCAKTVRQGKPEFLISSRRLVSWTGRVLVMREEMEESITWLTKSLLAFFSAPLPDMLSFYEEFLPLLQAIIVTKSSGTSHESSSPFQQAVDMCKDVSIKHGNDLNNVYEFLKTLANLYMGLGRNEEAIVVAETGLEICKLMGDNNVTDRINNRGRMLLYLAQMHQLNSTNSAFDRDKELTHAERYYLTDRGSAAKFVLQKNLSYANFLCEQKRFADADAVLRDMKNLGKELSGKYVYCAYFSRVFYGPGIQKSVEVDGELLSTVEHCMYSTMVRVFVGMRKKREAVATCKKLAANPVVVHDAIYGKRPSSIPYLIEACHRELLSLLSDEDQKQLQNCEFLLSPANIFKLYYMLNEYTLALKYYTNETQSPEMIEMCSTMVRVFAGMGKERKGKQ
jgi:tetratricopeptide (TPR) repeat protein